MMSYDSAPTAIDSASHPSLCTVGFFGVHAIRTEPQPVVPQPDMLGALLPENAGEH